MTTKEFLQRLVESYKGKLKIELVRELCPACAKVMESKGWTEISIATLLSSKKLKEMEMPAGMCETMGGAEGFFTRCADKMAGRVDDPQAFCAELHKQCLGKYPSEAKESIRYQQTHLLEADPTGRSFDVVLIESGVSKNGYRYSDEMLKREAAKFNGVKAYAYEFKGDQRALFDHLPDKVREQYPQGFAKNLVGDYSNARYGEFTKPDGSKGHGVIAKFNVAADWMRSLLKNAWEMGKRDMVGFSIDAWSNARDMWDSAGKKVKDVLEFTGIDEVTVVTSPGAGGILLNIQESQQRHKETVMKLKEIWNWLKTNFADAVKGITVNEENEDELHKAVMDAMAKVKGMHASEAKPEPAPSPSPAPAKESKPVQITLSDVQKAVEVALNARNSEASALMASRNMLEQRLKESNLPAPVQSKIKAQYWETRLSEVDLNKVIKAEQDVLGELVAQKIYVPNQTRESIVEVNKDQEDKFGDAILGMLTGEDVNKVPRFVSLHESYYKVNGYRGNQGDMGTRIFNDLAHSMPPPIQLYTRESYFDVLNDHRARLRESRQSRSTRLQESTLQTSTWAEIFGANMYKALLKSFLNQDFSVWKKIVSNIASVPDFRTQRRQRLGGFADLSSVAELGTYTEFTWPADEEITYSVSKYGNLAPLSMEAMINDDLGALKQIPQKAGLAAAHTLYKFVFDFIRTNPTFEADSVAVFHADHGNLGSTAFSDAALDDRVFAMADQTELTSGEVIRTIKPKFVLGPNELMRSIQDITSSPVSSQSGRTETMPNWFRRYELEPVILEYWSDATDWALVADPAQYDTIEIAFLNGRQEPEIFIQDGPTVGSVFTADKITWKIRYIFGGDVLDYRSMDKSVVAG